MEVNMTKIMLVEDDKSLREIYGVRLMAEGYEIISVGDGEAALAMAVKEKPDLILSDVMMPKISGFDMLDILRSTPETKDVKVIMMTALSSEDQRARGESLGANKYLVKSQVGIEDVVRTVHEVLADSPVVAQNNVQRFSLPVETAAQPTTPIQTIDINTAAPINTTTPIETAPTVANDAIPVTNPAPTQTLENAAPAVSTLPPAVPVSNPETTYAPNPIVTPPVMPESQTITAQITEPQPIAQPVEAAVSTQPVTQPEPVVLEQTSVPVAPMAPVQLPQPTAPFSTPAPASLGDRVINPVTPQAPPIDIASMMSQELNDPSITPPTQTPPQF